MCVCVCVFLPNLRNCCSVRVTISLPWPLYRFIALRNVKHTRAEQSRPQEGALRNAPVIVDNREHFVAIDRTQQLHVDCAQLVVVHLRPRASRTHESRRTNRTTARCAYRPSKVQFGGVDFGRADAHAKAQRCVAAVADRHYVAHVRVPDSQTALITQ